MTGKEDRRKNYSCNVVCAVDRRKMTAKRSEDLLRASIDELDRTIMRRTSGRKEAGG